jgi:hypothetical protein
VVPSHAVFHTPLKVNLEFEEVATPQNYLSAVWAGEKKLGKTIKVWRVQTKKFPEIDPGLVSNPYGFADSPDAEVISSGLNSKGPDSVALARHANFFLWGFSASPKDMTPEARKCFVNAVCYIKKFDGQRPIVRKVGRGYTRRGALLEAYYLRSVFDEAAFKSELPESLRNDAQQYARYRAAAMRVVDGCYPKELRRAFGNDPEKYIAWTKENLEYLRFEGGDGKTVVDPDVKRLGLSNRKVELLERCVSMLKRGEDPDLALRILKRYTTEDFVAARDWESWLAANRDRLFFTEVGGFKWLVAPKLMAAAAISSAERPDAESPVRVTAELAPAKGRPGETLDLIVRLETAPTWHIYAAEASKGPGIPARVTLDLPEGIESAGSWSYPEPARSSDGEMIYEGTFEFRHRLRVKASADRGPFEVACQLTYQACDPQSCRPPTTAPLKVRGEIAGD